MFRRKPQTPELPPEWMIVGLGNPGPEYRGTRHNVGFELIDKLAENHRIKLDQRKYQAQYAVTTLFDTPLLLVKPMTFMNRSGHAVASIKAAFNIPVGRILVVADEMDLPTGKLRLKAKGGPAGHNGHRSIIQSLESSDYPRLRLGVGRTEPGQSVDHVLGPFRPDERPDVESMLKRAQEGICCLLEEGLEKAMSLVNPSA